MEMQKIYYLDCTVKENRQELMRETMKKMKLDEKPTLEQLESFVKKLMKKYNDMPIVYIQYTPKNSMLMSIGSSKRGYCVIECRSMYECACKYILYVAETLKMRKKGIMS